MGHIRKIGEVYYIEFFARGLMYSQVAGLTEEGAREMLEKIESKISAGEALTIVRQINLDVFFERYLEDVHDQFSSKSIERFSSAWRSLLNFLNKNYPEVYQLSQITPFLIESYKAYLIPLETPKIVNFTLLLLREIFEYGIKIGFLNDNPSLHVTLLKMTPSPLRKGARSQIAKELLTNGVILGKIYQVLKLKDVAQVMFWSNFIPLKREDVYN